MAVSYDRGMSQPSGAVASTPLASIVIVTRNRKHDLRAALRSATAQRGAPEVLVMDDASSDGSADMVEREFPAVRCVRSPHPRGYIVQRNAAARLASAPIVISIDDDARFSSADVVANTVSEFADRRIGAVAMPFIHTARGPEVLQRSPSEGVWVTNAYIGTAHAVRRDVFLALGGYRETLEHFLEEPDFCLRLFLEGQLVRLGTSDPILHHESPRRDQSRGTFYLCRNHVLFTWLHVPWPDAALRLLGIVGYALWWGARLGHPRSAVQGLVAGARYARTHRSERRPTSPAVYRRWRALRRRPAPLDAVAPPCREDSMSSE